MHHLSRCFGCRIPAQRLTQMKYRNFRLWKVYFAHKHLRVSTLTLVKYVVSLISFYYDFPILSLIRVFPLSLHVPLFPVNSGVIAD